MCTLKVKQGKTLVSQAGSGKSIFNGNDEDNDNEASRAGPSDSISQIGCKRTYQQA